MTEFNPDVGATAGLQYAPRFKGSQPISSPTNSGAFRWVAQETVEPEYVTLFFDSVSQAEEGQGSGWELEFYDADVLGTTRNTANIHTPSEDIRAKGPLWGFDATETPTTFQTPDLWKALNSGSLSPSIWPNTGNPIDNDALLFPILVPGIDNNAYEYAARFDGITGTYTNERITRVSLVARCQEYVDIAFVAGMSITPFMYIDGIRYFGPSQKFNGETPGGHLVRADWFYNPQTRVSWKVPDVERFAEGASTLLTACSAGWIVDSTGSANNLATILQGYLEIGYTLEGVDGDPRIGYGPITHPVHGWNQISVHGMLSDPATTLGGFQFESGHTYIGTVRQRSGSGRLSWRYLDSGTEMEDVQPENVDTPLIAWSPDAYVLDSIVDTQTRRYTWVYFRTDSDPAFTFGTLAQPYASASGDHEPDLDEDTDSTLVNTDTDLYQTLAGLSAVDSYQWLRILVRVEDGNPTDDLVVVVESNLGASLASVTFTVDDLQDPIDEWQILEGYLDVAVTGAAAYRIHPTSAAEAGRGWRVQVASVLPSGMTNGPLLGFFDLTLGGTTERAVVDTVGQDHLDVAATIATLASTPTGFGAVAALGLCASRVDLSWTATALGADFLRYEIERTDSRTGWHRIASITTEAVVAMSDYEARFNTESSYRIRTRRLDWSVSAWSSSATATSVMDCCGYVLTTNVLPELTHWFDDIGTERATQFPEDVPFQRYQGRNFGIGFHPLEDDGAVFTRTLLVATRGSNVEAITETTTPGDRTYDPILAFRASHNAGLPYVCVLDQDGDRWFCSIQMANDGGTRNEPMGLYQVPVEFSEVTNVPYAIDVSP